MIAIRRRTPSAADRLLARDRPARRLSWLAIACGFFAAALVVAVAFLLSVVVSRVFLGGATLADAAPLLAVIVALAVVRAGLVFAAEVLAQLSASHLKGTLRSEVTARLLALGPAYAAGERSGELVSVLTNGMETLDGYVTAFRPVRTLAVLVPLLVVAVVVAIDPPTALVLVVTGPVLVLFLALIGSRAQEITKRRFLELRLMSAFFLDMLQGIATLKAFGRSDEQAANIETVSRSYGDTTMEVLRTAFQTALVLEWGATVATALVAVEVSLRLMAGTLSFDRALAVLIVTPEFFLPLRQLAIRFHTGTAGTAVAERMVAILDGSPMPGPGDGGAATTVEPAMAPVTPAIVATPAAPVARAVALGRAVSAPASAPAPTAPPEIRFSGVQFAYDGGRRPALRGLDLVIGRGRTVALVGATGAGKSTVASILLRFVDPDAGAVTVDGVPLAAIPRDAWRRAIAWVPQSAHLFAGTVADNLRLARPDATDAEVEDAAREADADAFIRALPRGYGTPLGESGLRLSGGQRQRLAIARAFLRDAPFVILDEATSHLDAASEAAVAGAIGRLVRRRTVLVIAHRLRLAAAADEVVVLDAGRAVESGPPAVLLGRDGAYRRLVSVGMEGVP